jgi:hypothetical protein
VNIVERSEAVSHVASCFTSVPPSWSSEAHRASQQEEHDPLARYEDGVSRMSQPPPPLDGGACAVLFIREPLHPWFPRACQRDTF